MKNENCPIDVSRNQPSLHQLRPVLNFQFYFQAKNISARRPRCQKFYQPLRPHQVRSGRLRSPPLPRQLRPLFSLPMDAPPSVRRQSSAGGLCRSRPGADRTSPPGGPKHGRRRSSLPLPAFQSDQQGSLHRGLHPARPHDGTAPGTCRPTPRRRATGQCRDAPRRRACEPWWIPRFTRGMAPLKVAPA